MYSVDLYSRVRRACHVDGMSKSAAGRGRAVLHRASADKLAHHRIAAQSVSVVDVFISSKAREDRLPQEADKSVPSIPTGAHIGDQTRRHVRQSQSVVQFPV